jgi:hypothetical protein
MRVSQASPVADGCTGGAVAGQAFVHSEVEPWLAIDRRDVRRVLGAWQQDRWSNGSARALVSASSSDGGATWQMHLHPMSRCGGAAPGSSGDFERVTDPWVDFSPDGTAYVMGLATTGPSLVDGSQSAMLVSRSSDGGRSWGTPVALIHDHGLHHNDKNTLTADPIDAAFVYAVWNRNARDGNGQTMFARSSDGGRSWEAARAIVEPRAFAPAGATRSTTIGNRIVVLEGGARRGALVNVYTQTDVVAGTTSRRIVAVRSFDKGLTWSTPSPVGNLRSVGTRDPATGVRVRDGNILPTVAAGPDGSVWVAWQDARFSAGARDAIVLARSLDGGATWSAPLAVNRVDSAPAFTPVLHVRADGRIGVLHYDLRSDTPDAATLLVDAWLVTSDDGVQWSETHVTGPFDMTEAPNAGGLFLGDYQGLASSGSHFVALVATANRDAANRSDVHAVRRDPDAAAAQAPNFSARATVPQPSRHAAAQFEAAQHEATLAAMERRIADWGWRVSARRQPRRRASERPVVGVGRSERPVIRVGRSERPVHRRAVTGVAQGAGVERAARAQGH